MPPYRVLIVDDSALFRGVLTEVLSANERMEVVGAASNGKIGLAKLEQLQPDAVVLDVEMPIMDGIETLRAIREKNAALPVIMFSTLTVRGAETTRAALSLGASDYATKPASSTGVRESIRRVEFELVPKILSCCERQASVRRARGSSAANVLEAPMPVRLPGKEPGAKPKVIVIGASTGGPNALERIVPNIPADLGVPILLVQHMPAVFTRYFAERLDANSALKVKEAVDGEELAPGTLYVAPGDYHMGVARRDAAVSIELNQAAPVNYCRPAIDVLFESVARLYGGETLAILLTGMGRDGYAGTVKLVEQNAYVLAQDEASSVVWGIPGFVVKAGLAGEVLPPEELVCAIERRMKARPLSSRSLEAVPMPGASGRKVV